MLLGEGLRMALANLWSHKMRSMLTILGVIIGIGSVLAMVTLGNSFEVSIVSQFDAVDDKTIYVYSSVTELGQGPPDCQQFCNIFTDVDLTALSGLAGVDRVTVGVDVPSTSLAWNGKQLTFESLSATVQDADEVRSGEDYASGGAFVDGQKQVVLGSTIAELLALSGAPEDTDVEDVPQPQAGDAITILFPDGRTEQATIAGVLLEDKTFFGDRNGRVFVPVDPFYTTKRPSPSTGEEVRVYAGFTLIADSVRDVNGVRDAADDYVQDHSDAAQLKIAEQTLAVDTAADIQGQISTAIQGITLFMGAIGGIALVVGAIGIANIMLVTVTERTREIGVMKAIGAKDHEVLLMFLLESVVIGVIGALIGGALGLGLGAGLISSPAFDDAEITLAIPYPWIGYAIGIGVGVGVVAGFLPARRATKIQPIQALAYE